LRHTLLTPVRHFWGDFVNTIGVGNDLYADAPIGPNPWTAEAGPGVIETQIYNIVQNATSSNIFAILRDALKLVTPATSVDEIISITESNLQRRNVLGSRSQCSSLHLRHRLQYITSSPWQAKRRYRS